MCKNYADTASVLNIFPKCTWFIFRKARQLILFLYTKMLWLSF